MDRYKVGFGGNGYITQDNGTQYIQTKNTTQ